MVEKGLKYTDEDLQNYCDLVRKNQEACEKIEEYTDTQKIIKRKLRESIDLKARENVNRINVFKSKKTGKMCFYDKTNAESDKLKSPDSFVPDETIREETGESYAFKTSRGLLEQDDSTNSKGIKMEVKPVLDTETTSEVEEDPEELSLSLGDLDKFEDDKDANIQMIKDKLSWITYGNNDPKLESQQKISSPEKLKKLHELELDLMQSNVDYLMEKKIQDLDYHDSLNKRAINCKNSQMLLDKTK